MKHCDLTCYENDGGDCVATTPGPTPEPTLEPTLAPTLTPTPEEPTPVVRGSLTLSGITSATRAAPVLRGAIAGVAGVPMEAVRIVAIQTQRRHLRRRLEASTVVDYEIEATDSEAVARKLAETTPAEFDAVIQDVAAAAGAQAAFKDVRTEEISVASAEQSEEEEDDDDDDASTAKFTSVKFIASVVAGVCCLAAALAVRWCLLHRRGKKTPGVVIEYPRLAPIKERPGAPVTYARPVASAPPLAPLAPEPPLASIKERALAEAAHATEPAPAGEYEAEC
jgi:hypothetical protein